MWVDADEAARILGVTRATLYAYVSRGRVRSQPLPGRRERRYAREDLERLRARSGQRGGNGAEPTSAPQWSGPDFHSAITLVADGTFSYRGRDALALARERTVDQVASLLWTGTFDADIFDTPLHVIGGGSSADLPFIARAQSVLPLVAARDPLAFDLRPHAVAETGWRLLNLLTSVAADTQSLEETVEGTLAAAWAPRNEAAPAILRRALILAADLDVDVCAFTARCVASAGSNPYGVVVAALAALDGAREGGALERVAALWDELRRARDVRKALAERLRRGEPVEGFGHPSFPDGDPRSALILELLPKSKERTFAHTFIAAAEEVLGERPALSFALVATERTLTLPRGAALTLYALARTIGWTAHAIEQYERSSVVRPAAR